MVVEERDGRGRGRGGRGARHRTHRGSRDDEDVARDAENKIFGRREREFLGSLLDC